MFRIPVRYDPGDAIHLYEPANTRHANTRSTPRDRLSFSCARVRGSETKGVVAFRK
jgi:hypothetical protein